MKSIAYTGEKMNVYFPSLVVFVPMHHRYFLGIYGISRKEMNLTIAIRWWFSYSAAPGSEFPRARKRFARRVAASILCPGKYRFSRGPGNRGYMHAALHHPIMCARLLHNDLQCSCNGADAKTEVRLSRHRSRSIATLNSGTSAVSNSRILLSRIYYFVIGTLLAIIEDRNLKRGRST